VEKELIDMLYGWEYIHKRGAWITADESFLQLIQENSLEFPEKIQGEPKLSRLLEDDPRLSKFLVKYFKDMVCQ